MPSVLSCTWCYIIHMHMYQGIKSKMCLCMHQVYVHACLLCVCPLAGLGAELPSAWFLGYGVWCLETLPAAVRVLSRFLRTKK